MKETAASGTVDSYEMLTVLTSQDNLTILIVDQEIRQALKISDYV